MSESKRKVYGAAKFKEHCLSLLDNLTPEGVDITKHGTLVARLIPYPQASKSLIGILKAEIQVRGDIFSSGIGWDAES